MIVKEYKDQVSTQSYGGKKNINGVEWLRPKWLTDDGGAFGELVRVTDGYVEGLEGFEVRQSSVSQVEPGAIKAFHLHYKQDDLWYVPPSDRLLVVLKDIRQDSSTTGNMLRFVLGGSNHGLVRIPAGVAHGCRNLSVKPALLMYFTSNQFNPEHPDEHRLPWDVFGSEIWEMTRG